MHPILAFLLSFGFLETFAQDLITPFEKSNGTQTATYFECMDYYRKLDKISSKISLAKIGTTDAGYPCEVALFSNDGRFDPKSWHRQNGIRLFQF